MYVDLLYKLSDIDFDLPLIIFWFGVSKGSFDVELFFKILLCVGCDYFVEGVGFWLCFWDSGEFLKLLFLFYYFKLTFD